MYAVHIVQTSPASQTALIPTNQYRKYGPSGLECLTDAEEIRRLVLKLHKTSVMENISSGGAKRCTSAAKRACSA